MQTIKLDDTLGAIAANSPLATQVLLRHRLDFCCGGHRTLAEACAPLALDPRQVAQEIEARLAARPEADGWTSRSTEELVEHIVGTYHAELRATLPALLEAAQKVERVHADKDDCPRGLAAHLANVSVAVDAHLALEEQVLFPAVLRAAEDPSVADEVRATVRQLVDEHDEHGANLSHTRSLAHDLEPPDGACRTWRALYHGLAELEARLMEHVHLENHVLFPRFQ